MADGRHAVERGGEAGEALGAGGEEADEREQHGREAQRVGVARGMSGDGGLTARRSTSRRGAACAEPRARAWRGRRPGWRACLQARWRGGGRRGRRGRAGRARAAGRASAAARAGTAPPATPARTRERDEAQLAAASRTTGRTRRRRRTAAPPTPAKASGGHSSSHSSVSAARRRRRWRRSSGGSVGKRRLRAFGSSRAARTANVTPTRAEVCRARSIPHSSGAGGRWRNGRP